MSQYVISMRWNSNPAMYYQRTSGGQHHWTFGKYGGVYFPDKFVAYKRAKEIIAGRHQYSFTGNTSGVLSLVRISSQGELV